MRRGSLGWMESGLGRTEESLLSNRITHQTALDPVVGVARIVVTSYQQFFSELGDLTVIVREGRGERIVSCKSVVPGGGDVTKTRSDI